MKIAIVGAGVVGGFVARELMRYKVDVVILERGADVAEGASKANSGIVHGGHDAAENSLKARYNVLGNRMMAGVCAELGVRYRNNGSLVLAFDAADMEIVRALKARGEHNGVEGLCVLTGDEARALEPHISEKCVGALRAPSGGIVCPYGLTVAAVGNAMDNGARLLTDFEVVGIERGARLTLHAADGRKETADAVVNCAGLHAADIAAMLGDRSFTVGCRRGQYLLFDSRCGDFVGHTLFVCPTAAGKGVLVTPTVDGNLLIGPTSETGEGTTATTAAGLQETILKAGAMVDKLPLGNVITSFAGVRAFSDRHDFIVEFSAADGLYNVAGIESPGLTSAPAIGRQVAEDFAAKYGLEKNAKFSPYRTPETFFRDMDPVQKNAYIAEHPDFGRMVCRCENVSLGELRHAARANPPAKTVDGLKRRTRAGMGRCQGGFCQPSVVEMLIEEFGLKPEEVTKDGGGSNLIVAKREG